MRLVLTAALAAASRVASTPKSWIHWKIWNFKVELIDLSNSLALQTFIVIVVTRLFAVSDPIGSALR